ncbi:MAG TPA: hypothetical protein VE078_01980 [Thermoanaerobaculia bacterium]|nr:hypothetical protein [Thermoanaerobaculia bacterium]
MRRTLGHVGISFVALAVLALPAIPAAAEVYTVTLKNGNVLETKYQPEEASFDSNMVLLLTEVGNWVGIQRDEIESVVAAAELSHFGKVIGKNTILLGWSANDAEDPNAPPAEGQTPRDPAAAATAQALQTLNQQRQAEQNYTIKQFVQPSETQGIPARMIGPYSPPQ